MIIKLLPLALILLLAGCENAPSPGVRPGPYVRPGLIMVPADQAHLYGVGNTEDRARAPSPAPAALSAMDVRSVQTDSAVTAIQFNRYADPARPNELMHEAHVVYRRDTSPRWRLQPASAQEQIMVGPRLTDGRGEVRPLMSQELESYIRDQRANAQRQQQAVGQLSEGIRQLALQQEQLSNELAKLRNTPAPETLSHSATSGPPAPNSEAPAVSLPSDRNQETTTQKP